MSKKVKVATKAPPQAGAGLHPGIQGVVLMDTATGLPLSFAFERIEMATKRAKVLIEQAKANVKGYAKIVSVALDRGFLDGDLSGG